MRADQQIQINTLLLEREALFVRIHELESAASALLGEPYPFTRPALPSDARPARRKSAGSRPAADPVRALAGRETAYRVTYRRAGQLVTEDHDDPAALRTLFASQGTHLQVTRLETLDHGARPQALLFTADPAPARL